MGPWGFKSNILKVFLSSYKHKNESQFINDFEILSVLRNLKIIGIFTRLANRDKKKKNLKLIPYAWKLIDNRMKNNSNFNDLINFLKENPKIKNLFFRTVDFIISCITHLSQGELEMPDFSREGSESYVR